MRCTFALVSVSVLRIVGYWTKHMTADDGITEMRWLIIYLPDRGSGFLQGFLRCPHHSVCVASHFLLVRHIKIGTNNRLKVLSSSAVQLPEEKESHRSVSEAILLLLL